MHWSQWEALHWWKGFGLDIALKKNPTRCSFDGTKSTAKFPKFSHQKYFSCLEQLRQNHVSLFMPKCQLCSLRFWHFHLVCQLFPHTIWMCKCPHDFWACIVACLLARQCVAQYFCTLGDHKSENYSQAKPHDKEEADDNSLILQFYRLVLLCSLSSPPFKAGARIRRFCGARKGTSYWVWLSEVNTSWEGGGPGLQPGLLLPVRQKLLHPFYSMNIKSK